MNCFFTNDVEHTSVNGTVYDRIAKQVDEVALPRLLDLYDKYNVRSTFFVLSQLAELRPNMVRQIVARGHEIGSHGCDHNYLRAFDLLSLEEQVSELNRSKVILEQLTGNPVVSFRAPALRVNQFTPMALKEAGYEYDSSVSSQRLDSFMSLGAANKRQWLRAPRGIYRTAVDNLARKGSGPIIEVPVSALGIPYIGTVMRISPNFLNLIVRYLLYSESKTMDMPINFLYHPSEAVSETEEEASPCIRSSSYIRNLFSGVLRAKVKMRNLNENAFVLLERELDFWTRKGSNFCTIQESKNFCK